MRTHLRTLAVALAIAAAPAVYAHDDDCNFDSDYDFTISDDALIFEREAGSPERVEFRQGQVWVDGRQQSLTAADRVRVLQFENDARAIVPEAKAIAVEAIDLAGAALEQVATAFTSGENRERIIDRGNQLRLQLRERIAAADSTATFDEAEFEDAIEEIVESAIPELVGGIAAMAMKAAFSGDESMVSEIEAKAEQLESTIEREVEARAELIEARADVLCERVRDLDKIESQFEFAMADGRSLDLLQTDGH